MTSADDRPRLLIVANTPSANTETLARAAESGAREIAEIAARRLTPPQAAAEDVLSANAVIIGTTENFGAMSGQIKDFFERVYYPCLEKTRALPWALYVRAGKDGAGTLRGVQSIADGLRWRRTREPLLLQGEWKDSFAEECRILGATVAAGLAAGIF
ncbi:MAG: flavodoxin family protein [Gammaproteobacteria bacterium]